jgi:hypothetical protein
MGAENGRSLDSVVTVSSNTLFHFTRTYQNLLGILEKEFEPRFCLEEVPRGPTLDEEPLEVALPMVCFCDLPLSMTSTHLSLYGDYGIGLSKEWGQRNGVSPIVYTYPGSALWQTIRQIIKNYEEDEFSDEFAALFTRLLNYVKVYEGRFWRHGRGYVDKVRFYNEREWRYVPATTDDGRWILTRQEFLDRTVVEERTRELLKSVRLRFSPTDVRYIIVAKDSEILEMVDDVLKIRSRLKDYTRDDLRLLSTRIISAEQIREDF